MKGLLAAADKMTKLIRNDLISPLGAVNLPMDGYLLPMGRYTLPREAIKLLIGR
ncbi:hypothetical protein [Labilibaculum manganireducens]|uniref:hypothetical protein n=1 Tax=Labilibaculum manganireducens TaxID=1940525 RepID=UPI0015D57CA2|nr:hypothetical protein [Labilibaculum manganireducens]